MSFAFFVSVPLNLKLSWKLALIGVSSMLPLLCGTLYLINKYTDKDIRFAVLEQSGNRFLQPLDSLLETLPQHQALVLRSRAGEPVAAAELAAKQTDVDQAFAALQGVTAELGASLQYSPGDLAGQKRAGLQLNTALGEWQEMKRSLNQLTLEEIGVRHARMMAQIRGLIAYIGNTSKLILDPDLDSFYLVDMILVALPQTQERLAVIVAAGIDILHRPDSTARERADLAGQAVQLKESDLDRLTVDAQTVLVGDVKSHGVSKSLQRNLPPAIKDFSDAAEKFIALIKPLAESGRSDVPLAKFAAAGLDARALSFKLWTVGSRELDLLLQKRIDDLNQARVWGLGLVALSMALAAGVTLMVARSINRVELQIRELNATLELRVAQRTGELEAANKELESFSYSVSHDLRAPLRGIAGFTEALSRNHRALLDAEGGKYLDRVLAGTERMGQLIDDLLNLSRVGRADLVRRPVDLSAMARSIGENLQQTAPQRSVEWVIANGVTAVGDSRLLHIVLENLLGNAWKFTGRKAVARIEFGAAPGPDGRPLCFIRDNGAGFDMGYAGKLFDPFQRMHSLSEFPGTGIGLATVKRIVLRHGGRVWADSKIDAGTTIQFSL